MRNIYTSDKPIDNSSLDRFKRYNFSKRIAQTIIHREAETGLVIGIYGAWGEGKTSVLNFIDHELKTNSDVIIVKFNPWRFTNEEALMLNFLKNLSIALDKELQNTKERIGNFIKKYGSIGSVFNIDLSKIGESISDTDLEVLKNRVNDFLKEANKKIVVTIDDIDRLDKQELFSLFKLVKLTGDFNNAYYLLSFDDKMVASAIGERFGDGSKESGFNFLEKIIQVPLKLPKALIQDLQAHCFEMLDVVLKENDLKLTTEEAQRFTYNFSQFVSPKLKTPRLAVRFANSLSFVIPLVKGEVNHSDLMLFEALKIFYPEHFEFIKSNSHYFTNSYEKLYDRGRDQQKVDEVKDHLKTLGEKLSKEDRKNIERLLIELFPPLNEALHNSFVHKGAVTWTKDKRIASAKYFNRYLMYTIGDGEISDVYFDSFIENIAQVEMKAVTNEMKEMLKSISPIEFINKLSINEEKFDWETAKKIIAAISYLGLEFPADNSVFSFGFSGAKSQAAMLIFTLLKNQGNTDESFEIAKSLMDEPTPFEFAYEINKWLRTGKEIEEKLFTLDQYKDIAAVLRLRALKESGEIPIYEKYSKFAFFLLGVWQETNEQELQEYLLKNFNKKPDTVMHFLVSITSTITSSDHPEPYKADFCKEDFDFTQTLTNTDNLYHLIRKFYGKEMDEKAVEFFDRDNYQTDINILRQFEHWYKKN